MTPSWIVFFTLLINGVWVPVDGFVPQSYQSFSTQTTTLSTRHIGYQTHPQHKQASPSLLLASNNHERSPKKQSLWHPARLISFLFRSLVLGLTLPFPQLREIVQRQDKQQGLTIGLKLRECIAFLAFYMAVGVVAFSFVFETWSIVDSMYFTCVCFSTVG